VHGGNLGGCDNPVTGEASFDEDGAGFYRISDATFGQYDCAWGDTPAAGVTITDVCNDLNLGRIRSVWIDLYFCYSE
jgi:hypothetical protein